MTPYLRQSLLLAGITIISLICLFLQFMGLVNSSKDRDDDVALTKKDFVTHSLENIVKVSCGECHTAALDSQGRVCTW